MTIPRFAAYQQAIPFRRVDWRWQRAWRLIMFGMALSRREDDTQTLRAAKYLRELTRCKTPKAREKVITQAAAMSAAVGIHESPSANRLELEARLLAGEPLAVIAAKCKLGQEVVETYEALFYNVSHALEARDYIFRHVIRMDMRKGAEHRSFETVFKSFAFHFGGQVVDLMVDLWHRDREQPQTASPAELNTEEGRLRETLRLAMAVSMLPQGDMGSCGPLEIHRFLTESASKWVVLQPGSFVLESVALLSSAGLDQPLRGSQAQPDAPVFESAEQVVKVQAS